MSVWHFEDRVRVDAGTRGISSVQCQFLNQVAVNIVNVLPYRAFHNKRLLLKGSVHGLNRGL